MTVLQRSNCSRLACSPRSSATPASMALPPSVSSLVLTPTQTLANGNGRTDNPTSSTRICRFPAHFGFKRTPAESSGHICTAEVRGLHLLGSTCYSGILVEGDVPAPYREAGLVVAGPTSWSTSASTRAGASGSWKRAPNRSPLARAP